MFGRSSPWQLGPATINKAQLVKVGAGVVAVGAASSVTYRNKDFLFGPRAPWNNTVVEAIAGAAGEVAQMALLYPLDTVKVRCQAAGLSSRKVLAHMFTTTGGNWAAIFSALYAGILPGMALSVVVGSVHYACFCATRRVLNRLLAVAAASSSNSNTNSAQKSQSRQQEDDAQLSCGVPSQRVLVSHGTTGTHFNPMKYSAEHTEEHQQHPSQANSSQASAAAVKQNPVEREAGRGSMAVTVAAAVMTAALTAVVEAPLELFRHNSQAGQIQGNFVKEMWKALRKSGPRALYYGMIPYCLESWPYDISELVVVGAAKDMRNRSGSNSSSWSKAQDIQYDLATGAAGGTVAVLVSMPFDVIKTYMQTHGTGMDAVGLKASVAAFCGTGQQLVTRSGPGSLFVGLAPRLAHQVPGAMICWLVVGSCHDWLVRSAERQRVQQQPL